MARSRVYKKGKADIAFNMTPMIDCTFQLILFFMLSTQMYSTDYVKLTVPEPTPNPYQEIEYAGTALELLVTVAPFSEAKLREYPDLKGHAQAIVIRGTRYDIAKGKMAQAARRLREIKRDEAKDREMIVEVRADRWVQYQYVEMVLQALHDAEIKNMRLRVKKEGRT